MASGSRSVSKGSEEAFLYECEPCKFQNLTSEAKAYCTVCTEYLCQRCEQAHKGLKATRDHKLLTGKDIHSVSLTTKPNVPAIFCDMHKSMIVNEYCKDHDDVICGTCKITEHKKCNTSIIRDQKKRANIKNSFDDAAKALADLKLRYEKLTETRKTDESKILSELNKCLEDMRTTRKEINQAFDALERSFEREVKEANERMRKEIGSHVRIAEDALEQISEQIKFLGEVRKSKNDDVMFIGMKKATKLNDKYDQILSTVQQAIYPIEIQFRANDVISDVIQKLKFIGTLDGVKHPSTGSQRKASLFNISVVDKKEIDVITRYVLDCTFMKSGHLVLAGDDSLILHDESLNVQSQLSVTSVRVAAINENEVVVTKGMNKQLLRVRLFPQMAVMTTVKMDRQCWGVDVFNDEIYVACNDGKGHGEVQVLNMDGKIQRKLGVNTSEYMFKWPDDVKVIRDCSKVFVSDVGTHKVTCLNQQGHVIYEYSDPDLKFPKGLYVDEDDTLLVCGRDSNNIHMVGRDGRKVKVWLTQKDGVVDPNCVSYRQKDGCLVVGLRNKNKPLLVFNTKF